MAASVLNSAKAVQMSVEVVRAFVRLRGFLASHRQLAAKLEELEKQIASHDKKDARARRQVHHPSLAHHLPETCPTTQVTGIIGCPVARRLLLIWRKPQVESRC